MSKEHEALKLALEALEGFEPNTFIGSDAELLCHAAIAALREALAEQPAPPPECQTEAEKTAFAFGWWKALEQKRKADSALDRMADNARELGLDYEPAQQQEPVAAIRALTNQCAALIQERDELQKQVWRYEKNGVTCQTYRHKIDRTCSECNVQEDYTSPQPSKPCEWQQEDSEHMPDTWRSDCGVLWTFTDGGPIDNDMKHCCGCGAKLKEKNK